VPHNAEDLRDPEFLDAQEVTEADDSELKFKTSAEFQLSNSKLKVGVRAWTSSATSPSAYSRTTTASSRRTRTDCRSSMPRTSARTAL
jgi:hypothetical protein